jgi:hypothetical protein
MTSQNDSKDYITVKAHDGGPLFEMRISRNLITIEILKMHDEIHKLEGEISLLIRGSIQRRIKWTEQMNELEKKQINDPSIERNEEVDKILRKINEGFHTQSEIKIKETHEKRIAVLKGLITYRNIEFERLNAEVEKLAKITVYTGKIRNKTLDEEFGIESSATNGCKPTNE